MKTYLKNEGLKKRKVQPRQLVMFVLLRITQVMARLKAVPPKY